MKTNPSVVPGVPTKILMAYNKIQRFRIKPTPESVKAGHYLRVYCRDRTGLLFMDHYCLNGVASKTANKALGNRGKYVIHNSSRNDWGGEEGRYEYLDDFAAYAQAYKHNSRVLNFFRELEPFPEFAAILFDRDSPFVFNHEFCDYNET